MSLIILIFSSLLFCIFYCFRNMKFYNRGYFKKAFLLFFTLLIVSFSFFLSNFDYKGNDDSIFGRKLIYKISFKMLQERPFIGIGYGEFKSEYNSHQSEYFTSNETLPREEKVATENYYAFNDFLQTTIEQGVFGSGIFIMMILFIINVKNKRFSDHLLFFALKLVIVSILISGLVYYTLTNFAILILFWTVLGCSSNFLNSTFNFGNSQIIVLKSLNAMVLLILILLNLNCFRYINQWFNIYQYPIFNRNTLAIYADLLPKMKKNGVFLVDYSKRLQANNEHAKNLDILKMAINELPSTETYSALGNAYAVNEMPYQAELNYIKACYVAPNRFTPKYKLLEFYILTNQTNKGISIAHKILEQPIKVPSLEIEMIKRNTRVFLNENLKKDFFLEIL
ncbi:O-antigen ligase family protein [Sinomicrobium kalidii]|nr:O-antigen ligase family protein [Sinomicrobium kalidii]